MACVTERRGSNQTRTFFIIPGKFIYIKIKVFIAGKSLFRVGEIDLEIIKLVKARKKY